MVGYETAIAKRPQQIVQAVGFGTRSRVDMNAIVQPVGFFCQPAREHLA
jgi:exonuclease I